MNNNYKDDLIYKIADRACIKVTNIVVRAFQGMTDSMLSGSDILKNTWDEICVQVQQEYSIYWDAYVDTIERFTSSEIENLDAEIKQAIWLQTDEGVSWNEEAEENDKILYYEDDILHYIVNDYILLRAANYTNKRIEEYIWG